MNSTTLKETISIGHSICFVLQAVMACLYIEHDRYGLAAFSTLIAIYSLTIIHAGWPKS